MPALLPETVEALAKLIEPTHGFDTEAPSLLDQLKEEIFVSTVAGSGASTGAKVPFAIGAYDLYAQIEAESAALIVGAATYPTHTGRENGIWGQFGSWDWKAAKQIPSALTEEAVNAFTVKKWKYAFSSPLENIIAWVEGLQTDYQIEVAGRIIARWVDAITRLLYPIRTSEFLSPCLACGARWFHDRQTNGRSASVIITVPDGVLRADCRTCLARWSGGRDVAQMMFDSEMKEKLATVVDNDSQMA